MKQRVERPGVCTGYDLWSETYDRTPNPLVALDRRHTMLDYLTGFGRAGFLNIKSHEFQGDAGLVKEVPSATKYLDGPLLLVIEGWRASRST